MREIKFRAWDREKKKMLHWGSGIIYIDHHLNIQSAPHQAYYTYDPTVKNPSLMQFTGLQDSKGVDIYEGDICISFELSDSEAYMCQWEKEYLGFWFYCKETDTYLGCASYKNLEVIGNIYENPELLEGEKE